MHHSKEPVNFTINGTETRAEPGETTLSVARRLGIAVPTLCHHEALTPRGGCRLCVVEVFWGNRSKLVTSCIYVPYEGDRIETDNERIHKTRRLVLELLLARCPNVELLWEMGRAYGIDRIRLAYTEENENENERCILCGLCVRVCDEIVGQHAIGYYGRGTERRVTTPFKDQSHTCIGCAACVFICPTGALHYTDERHERVLPELHTRVLLSQCRECGVQYAPDALITKVAHKVGRIGTDKEICPACRRRAYGKEAARLLGKNNLAFHASPEGDACRSRNRRPGDRPALEVVNGSQNTLC